MQKRIKKIQTAIFTRNFSITNNLVRANILTAANERLNKIFNGVPAQLPIPNDAPSEIPRFILTSADGKFGCNIAISRTDVFFNVPETESSIGNLSNLLDIQKNNAEDIFRFLAGIAGISVNRIGFISLTENVLDLSEGNAVSFLRDNFIVSGKLESPKELSFRYNRSGKCRIFEMNNIIDVKGNLGTSISMQTDVNTVAENMESANFDEKSFTEIIEYAAEETKSITDNFLNV